MAAAPAPSSPLLLRLYGGVARFPGPALARLVMRRRAARGKEDPARLPERFGVAGRARPPGPLIWLHAASVGESLSLLPLIETLRRERPEMTILTTTGTRTSAALMAERLPEGAIHQFAPVDTRPALRRFLAHWRPDFLGVAESELWPTMLAEAKRAGLPTALLSARVSAKTEERWSRAPRSIAALLGRFDLILAQDAGVAARLARLGADPARLQATGSLKLAADPLPADPAAAAEWRAALAGRPLWLAASTHAGEETAVLAAHRRLAARWPDLLTVLAPRHPERGDAVAAEIEAAGIGLARRSRGARPGPAQGVLLVDVLGELGLWFRLCPLSFIGGSLAPLGGHNPLEPARLGSAPLIGPHAANMTGECALLEDADALIRVEAGSLADQVAALLDDAGAPTAAAQALAARAQAATAAGAGVTERYLTALAPLLPQRKVLPQRKGEPHARA